MTKTTKEKLITYAAIFWFSLPFLFIGYIIFVVIDALGFIGSLIILGIPCSVLGLLVSWFIVADKLIDGME